MSRRPPRSKRTATPFPYSTRFRSLNGRPIRSRAGAMGLMQLMPATWADMRARVGLGRNPDDPRDNILAATFCLRLMYDRFGYPGLFGAYKDRKSTRLNSSH